MIDSIDAFTKLDGFLTKEMIDVAMNGEYINEWRRASYPVITDYFANVTAKHSEKTG